MNRSLRSRIAVSLTACALLLSLISGCGKPDQRDILLYGPEESNAEEDKISLTFFGFKADAMDLTAIEAALQSFMATHKDVNITYEGIKGPTYWYAFDKRDAANVLDDIFMVHHDHLISLRAEGELADLSDLPGIENYSDEVKGQFIDPDGSVYFLPTQISTYNLYINYDLLRAHGQRIPKNWSEFQQVCDYFVSQGIVPIIANNHNSLPTLAISKGLFDLYQHPDAEVAVTLQAFNQDPALLAEALEPGVAQVADMLARGWFDPAEVLKTEQTSDDLALFAQGERPFMLSGGWASYRVMALEPGFTYGVHPYPILDDGSVLSLQVDTCISVNAQSPHLPEAKAFVAHLIQPDVMWDYCNAQASYTPLRDSRAPSESTMAPSIDYLTNGRVAFRSEYRMELPMETALQQSMDALLHGASAAQAQALLAQELKNK